MPTILEDIFDDGPKEAYSESKYLQTVSLDKSIANKGILPFRFNVRYS